MSTHNTDDGAPATTPRRRNDPLQSDGNRIGLVALMTDAQSLKESARDTYNRASRLVVAIKRHRKQSKLMASTLASLKQLQTIDA